MCYARRQRSSWARIKLSNKLYILRLTAVRFVWAIYLSFLYFFRVVFSLVLTDFVFALAFCFVLLLSVVQLSSFNLALFARACLLYHFSFDLSRGFSKLFLKTFENFFRKVLTFSCNSRADISPPLQAATRIFYHAIPILSSDFEKNILFGEILKKDCDDFYLLYTLSNLVYLT